MVEIEAPDGYLPPSDDEDEMKEEDYLFATEAFGLFLDEDDEDKVYIETNLSNMKYPIPLKNIELLKTNNQGKGIRDVEFILQYRDDKLGWVEMMTNDLETDRDGILDFKLSGKNIKTIVDVTQANKQELEELPLRLREIDAPSEYQKVPDYDPKTIKDDDGNELKVEPLDDKLVEKFTVNFTTGGKVAASVGAFDEDTGELTLKMQNKLADEVDDFKIESTVKRDGKPLQGAKVVLESSAQVSTQQYLETWSIFNPEPDKNPLDKKLFTSDKDGNIVIDEEDDADMMAMLEKYAGKDGYKKFRFRMMSSPDSGDKYLPQPPRYGVTESKEDPQNGLENFVSEMFVPNVNTSDAQVVKGINQEKNKWGTSPWYIDKDNVLHIESGELSTDNGNDKIMWSPISFGIVRQDVTAIHLDGNIKAPVNSKALFHEYRKNKEFKGLEKLDTSNVTNMYQFFAKNDALEELVLPSNFNSSKVTNMDYMFQNDGENKKLDIKPLDTTKVTTMSGMFNGNKALETIILGDGFKFVGTNANFPAAPTKEPYTGKWMRELPKWIGTNQELMANKPGNMAGTYTWEKKDGQFWGDVPWDFDEKSGVLTLEGSTDGKRVLGIHTESPWFDDTVDPKKIKEITIKDKMQTPVDSKFLFSYDIEDSNTLHDLSEVTKINGLNNLDTSHTTDMYGMFSGMSSVTQLDVTKFNTSKVTKLGNMFAKMKSLETIDVSNFDTSNVIDMYGMFRGMNNLTTLDLSNFTTSKVTLMDRMFSDTPKLKKLDLSHFETDHLIGMTYMFNGMKELEELDLSSFNTIGERDNRNLSMDSAFNQTYKLKKLTLGEKFEFRGKPNLQRIIPNDEYTGNWIRKEPEWVGTSDDLVYKSPKPIGGTYVWEKREEDKNIWGSVPWEFDKEKGILVLTGDDAGSLILGESKDSPWNKKKVSAKDIKEIHLVGKIKAPTNSSYLFSNSDEKSNSQLVNTVAFKNLSSLDTSDVTNMSGMFAEMESLEEVDVSKFNTSKVTDMSEMFRKMKSIQNLDVSKFDTTQVTSMMRMFDQMSSVININLGQMSTTKVTTMKYMFAQDRNLEELNLSSFDTSKVTDMTQMFTGVGKMDILTLGDNFKFVGDNADLPNIIKDEDYTGNWIREDPKWTGTSKDLMANKPKPMGGTYIWEYTEDGVIIKNPTFRKRTEHSGQTTIPNWRFHETDYSVTMGSKLLEISDEKMGPGDKYNRLVRTTGGGSYWGDAGVMTANNGKLEMDISGKEGGGPNDGVTIHVSQLLDTKPGKGYRLTTEWESNADLKRNVVIYDGDKISGSGGEFTHVEPDKGTQTITTLFTAKSDQTTLSYRFYAKHGESAESAISNLEIEELDWFYTYPGWENARTEAIPKDHVFMMKYTNKTEIVDYSDGIDIPAAQKSLKNTVEYDVTNGKQWIEWKNVGYYKGQNVGVKLTVDPKNLKPDKYNTIGFRKGAFLNVSMLPGDYDIGITYEFLDEDRQPLKIDGYWNMSGISNNKFVTLDKNQFDHAYGFTDASLITYELDGDDLTLTGQGYPGSSTGGFSDHFSTTFTYTNRDSFAFSVRGVEHKVYSSTQIIYDSTSLARVSIPDPQPLNQVVDKVDEKNKDKLTNEFIQFVPSQAFAYRSQDMVWSFPVTTQSVFAKGNWQIYDESGANKTKNFTINTTKGTIEPANKYLTDLYDHYYTFVYTLPFDTNKEINPKDLVEKDGGKYYEYKQDISLKVDKITPVNVTLQTDINFLANVDYKYIDEENNQIEDSSLKKSDESLITARYPVVTGPNIKGYAYNTSVPIDLAKQRVLYSDNQVTFVYDKIKKVWMTVNYYQLSDEGKPTKHAVIEDLKKTGQAKTMRKEVDVGNVISEETTPKEFESYLYKYTNVFNDVTEEMVTDDIVPSDDFNVNYYYQPLENLSVPKTISFGERNAQKIKDEYPVKNDPTPIILTSGYQEVDWSLHASSDGLFSDESKARLFSDMYFRIGDEKKVISKEDTSLASNINRNYYDIPLVTEDDKEGLFLKIGPGTKESSYSGTIKFSMVTGP